MAKDKKAAIEVQMNWIFVMIIGGIILFFFIGIVAKQRSVSEQKLVNDLLQDIDQYIVGASVATRGAATLPVPGYDIYFSCDSVEIKKQRSQLEQRIVFAPDYVDKDDRQLIVWALPWEVPYEVTNFLYATGPGIRYVFVYEDEKYDEFFTNFVTDKINKVKVGIKEPGRILDFSDEGNYKHKIIMLGRMEPVQLPGFAKNKRTSFVWIPDFDPRERLPYGPVYFLQYNPTSDEFDSLESKYIGTASLTGAIFSDSLEEYDCAMKKAFRNLNVINKIFAKKIGLLSAAMVCPAFYGEYDINLLSKMDEYTSQPDKWADNIEDLISTIDSLRQRNALIESQSCPLIY